MILQTKKLQTTKFYIIIKLATLEKRAGLAHEIKNPLTYIKSNLEIIDLQKKNNITYTEDVINSIREGVERINQLTDDFRIRSSENLNDSILHQ